MGEIRGITSAKSATQEHRDWVAACDEDYLNEMAYAATCNAHGNTGAKHVINRGGTKHGVCIHCRRTISKRADGVWVADSP